MLTTEKKLQIIEAIAIARTTFSGSDAKFSVMLGINPAQYNTIKKGKTDSVLSEGKWLTLARKMELPLGAEAQWITAETPVYITIKTQLEYCQKQSTNGIFCDKADIGKTHTAKVYVKQNMNAVYIDCSQYKTKQKLVRAICREFGVDHAGKYADVYADLVYYLKTIPNPLIILDEAGDLDYGAFLELKALWNAVENYCGWYMMGADGLQKKMNSGIERKKVGFTEIFSRYGGRFQSKVPAGTDAGVQFRYDQGAAIIAANAHGPVDVEDIINRTAGSLRRIRLELKKLRNAS